MAPLYKRYIPPDDQIRRQKEPESTVGLGIKIDGQEVRPGKRKRDEQQQVKARKARKADRSENTETTNDIEREGLEDTLNDGTVEQELQSLATQDGSFAHIKSSKKRHKLEKEARKARKLATLSRDNTVNDSIPQNTESPVHAAVHPVVAASKALQNAVGQRQPSEELNMSGTEDRGDEKKPSAGDSGILHTQETKQDVEDEDISDHDEAYLKKHASILGKFAKSKQRSDKIQAEKNGDDQDDADTERPVIKDLTPFGVELEDEKPRVAMSALPEWLARPTLVTQTTNKSFRELGLSDETSRHLAECGFAEALPVQQALLPDLLPTGSPGARFPPGTETILPDIAVSAPTGSGKTLAYLLPLIESLKKQPSSRGIAALIIVPTRELATQVAAVAVQLAKGSKITTGIACGGNKLADEQKRLMKISYEYDPSAYNEAVQALFSIQNPPLEENVEEMDEYMTTIDEKLEQKQYFLDTLNGRSGHVPRYDATFDVLVCTPGRLFEHLANTNGFNLSDVRWLVLDEADKLLDEQYHGLLDTLNEELAKERPIWMRGPRENHLRNHSLWNDAQERAVRKVVLSATMTKDVSKLAGLQLKRPKLVVIGTREQETGLNASKANTSDQRGEIFELPTGLQEYYCPVGLGEQKPVQLLHLIETRVLVDHGRSSNQSMQIDNGSTMSSDSDSDSESSSDSEGSDSASSGSGESDSDSDIDSSNASITSIDSVDEVSVTAKKNDSITQNGSVSSIMPTILIFTASTEAALRLTQLLKTLRPDMSSSIRSITKTNNGNALTSLATGKPCIVVATDRAGRGLDTIAGRHITHVIQYDVPRSIVMYVHRVGRTARAGREGQAWTLYTRSQARWFIKEVLKAPSIQRAANLRKVMIEELDEEMLRRYDKALERLRKQVFAKKP